MLKAQPSGIVKCLIAVIRPAARIDIGMIELIVNMFESVKICLVVIVAMATGDRSITLILGAVACFPYTICNAKSLKL
jgi:hypothetical protein